MPKKKEDVPTRDELVEDMRRNVRLHENIRDQERLWRQQLRQRMRGPTPSLEMKLEKTKQQHIEAAIAEMERKWKEHLEDASRSLSSSSSVGTTRASKVPPKKGRIDYNYPYDEAGKMLVDMSSSDSDSDSIRGRKAASADPGFGKIGDYVQDDVPLETTLGPADRSQEESGYFEESSSYRPASSVPPPLPPPPPPLLSVAPPTSGPPTPPITPTLRTSQQVVEDIYANPIPGPSGVSRLSPVPMPSAPPPPSVGSSEDDDSYRAAMLDADFAKALALQEEEMKKQEEQDAALAEAAAEEEGDTDSGDGAGDDDEEEEEEEEDAGAPAVRRRRPTREEQDERRRLREERMERKRSRIAADRARDRAEKDYASLQAILTAVVNPMARIHRRIYPEHPVGEIILVASNPDKEEEGKRKGAYQHVNIYLDSRSKSPFKTPGLKLNKTIYQVGAVKQVEGFWEFVRSFSANKRGGPPITKMDRGPPRPATLPEGTIPWKLQVTRWWSADRSFNFRVTDVVEGPGAGLLACEYLGLKPDKFWLREGLSTSLRLTKDLREKVQKTCNRDCSKW